MATAIPVQALPANGAPLTVAFTAADGTGMTFSNSGRELLLIDGGATPAGATVDVEGVPAGDSGRDGSAQFAPGTSELLMGGPYKQRNFNNGGIVELTVSSAETLTMAVVRFDPNG